MEAFHARWVGKGTEKGGIDHKEIDHTSENKGAEGNMSLWLQSGQRLGLQ